MPLRILCLAAAAAVASTGWSADLSSEIALLRSASGAGAASPQLQQAWRRVAAGDPAEVTTVLAATGGASTTGQNWLRTAADAMAQRALDSGDGFPRAGLEAFLLDSTNPPRGRRAAYEWLVKENPDAGRGYLAKMLGDPSIELRYDAIAAVLADAAGAQPAAKQELLNRALESAVDLRQLEKAAEQLKELGQEVDLVQVMGFIVDWKIVGPFDNVGGVGYDAVYPPEEGVRLDETYPGKQNTVVWQPATAEGALGELDITETLGPEKGAVAYLHAAYTAGEAVDAQVRLASSNAVKLWVNGEQVGAFKVYHAGNPLDQYRCPVSLREGKNEILVKVCQNEQTEGWAQTWDLQLRITDPLGEGLPAAE